MSPFSYAILCPSFYSMSTSFAYLYFLLALLLSFFVIFSVLLFIRSHLFDSRISLFCLTILLQLSFYVPIFLLCLHRSFVCKKFYCKTNIFEIIVKKCFFYCFKLRVLGQIQILFFWSVSIDFVTKCLSRKNLL